MEWFDDATDEAAHYALNDLGTHIQSAGEKSGKLFDYQFMNDASYSQTILGSYGEDNFKLLRSVAERYDPKGLFQDLQNGGFLLGRV